MASPSMRAIPTKLGRKAGFPDVDDILTCFISGNREDCSVAAQEKMGCTAN